MNKRNLKQWLKTSRLQTALVTSFALWIGYMTVGNISIQTFIVLGILGVLLHVWGFVMNEVQDAEYDRMNGDSDGHPLAQGMLDKRSATILSWGCGIVALVLSLIYFSSLLGSLALLASFGAGIAYNYYSKKHWWSNVYLSMWIACIVFSGAAFAGSFTIYTWMLAAALAIQLFVQVIEGDLKDILGPENTFAEHMGVQCENDTTPVKYPAGFRQGIMGLKLVELVLVSFVVYSGISVDNTTHIFVLGTFIVLASAFVMTSTYYLTTFIDRDEIKRRSSMHELSSILMIGVSSYWLNNTVAIFVAIAPVIWYAMFNKLLHSGTLNPDV